MTDRAMTHMTNVSFFVIGIRTYLERLMAWQDQGRKENGEFDNGTSGSRAKQITGGASYYNLPGNNMANGKPFDANAMNAAMLNVPRGTKVKVLSLDTSKSVEVTVTDRGPYVTGRIIDLTPNAF